MLKRGMMRIGDAEYTVYELRVKGFYRLDIVKKGGAFHVDADSVLFSCFFSSYRRKRQKQFGDAALYQKYRETVDSLRGMPGRVIREAGWESGKWISLEQKGEAGNRFVAEFHDGDWFGEIYERGDVTVVMGVLDGAFKTALPPVHGMRVPVR
jgi:hypothetical protein